MLVNDKYLPSTILRTPLSNTFQIAVLISGPETSLVTGVEDLFMKHLEGVTLEM